MVAATVLLFAIVTAITAGQRGLQALDTARNLATSSQLMQSEMERLRLMSWAQLQTLQQSGDTKVALPAPDRFSCTREIADLKTDMKQITLTASWHGYDARMHTARLLARDGENTPFKATRWRELTNAADRAPWLPVFSGW